MRLRLISLLACILLAAPSSCARRPRRPRNSVPVVFTIGWWVYQDGLAVTVLDPAVLEAPLNLFGSEALVSFRIAGHVSYPEGHWRPYVQSVHVSEQFTPESRDDKRVAVITLTPVIGVKEDPAYRGESVSFGLVVEHTLHTFAWGQNRYIVRSGAQERSVELFQRK